MATEQENKNKELVLNEYEEVWNKGNFDFAHTAVSPKFEDHPPTRFFDVGRVGPEALKEAAMKFRSGFRDFHDTAELLITEGDKVVYLGMIDGHHEAEAFGFPPTGRMMRVWGVNFFRLEDGQIVEQGSRVALSADPDSRLSQLTRTGLAEVLA